MYSAQKLVEANGGRRSIMEYDLSSAYGYSASHTLMPSGFCTGYLYWRGDGGDDDDNDDGEMKEGKKKKEKDEEKDRDEEEEGEEKEMQQEREGKGKQQGQVVTDKFLVKTDPVRRHKTFEFKAENFDGVSV